MQKKVIKRKKSPNTRSKSKSKSTNNSIKIAILLAGVAIILLTYMTLGIELTILMAILLAIVYGVWHLLQKIQSKTKKRKVVSILLIIFFGLGITCLVGFSAFMIYVKAKADPLFDTANLNTVELTRLYDKDGKEFAKLGSEKREKVSYEQLPEVLIDAIVATEDSRFFQHNGFDAPRFLKAALGQLAGHSGAGGASTLSMQVVKNSFTDHLGQKTAGKDGIVRKFEDIYLAVFKLEKKYSKEEIIEYYVNNHFLGGNIYGVQEAAKTYFGKDVSELNLSEAATIAGMFKSPNYYRPNVNPKNATARRQTVLNLMVRHGYITKEEADIAAAIPMDSLTTTDSSSGILSQYQGYIDTIADEITDKYGINPYTTPLLVYTNLDRSRQDAVNSVLNGENYNWINNKVQTGVAVLDSETGKILAIGNGRNVNKRSNDNVDQYNYATQIKRQPGSTAKPYLIMVQVLNITTGQHMNYLMMLHMVIQMDVQ